MMRPKNLPATVVDDLQLRELGNAKVILVCEEYCFTLDTLEGRQDSGGIVVTAFGPKHTCSSQHNLDKRGCTVLMSSKYRLRQNELPQGSTPSVLALPDEEYPSWLWNLLDKSELPDDGPGGKAEKRLLRKENGQRIWDQVFIKTP